MITYEHINIKGGDANIVLNTVNLLTGPSRSSKSAKLDGLALAAKGRSIIGGTGAKLSKLISRGESTASATIKTDNGQSFTWSIKQTEKDGKVTNSCKHTATNDQLNQAFGEYICIDDFWSLTNEEKWRVIGSLVTARIP